MALQTGTTSNRYTILGRLAGGGMADIFLARAQTEAGVERYLVLKRVLAEKSRDPHFAQMFLDEARLAAQLQHPNIAQVYDIGKLAGSYFFTMEYVHGEDVRQVMQRMIGLKRRIPVNLVLYIVSGVLAALQHAHARQATDGTPLGVVHRDVTPSNIMVSFEGMVKLLDFGVAKAAQRSTETQSGSVKGKIAYLSPEQCRGVAIDRRSDLYSLGIVMHEMLTGRRMYRRETDFASMTAIANEPSPPPSQVRPEISRDLDAIVLKALAKQPADRFASAGEMLEAIELLATHERHLVSSTATARFMRELFGEKPEPWIELAAQVDSPAPVTITGDPLDAVGAAPMLPAFDPDSHLVAQLDAAPALYPDRNDASEELDPASLPVEDTVSASPMNRPTTQYAATSGLATPEQLAGPSAMMTSAYAPIPTVSAFGPLPTQSTFGQVATGSGFAPLPGPPARRRPVLMIAVLAVAAVSIGVALALRLSGGGDEPPAPLVRAAVVVVDAAISHDAPPPDAAEVAAVIVDAALPTIADAATREDWSEVARLCELGGVTREDRGSCAIAACKQNRRAQAVAFYQASSRASHAAVERACREANITLVAPKPLPKRDPCEANPLACQK